jgi:hypothetical protein
MERHVLFIRSDQRAKLNSLAEEARVSIAEIAIAKRKPKAAKMVITENA